MNVTTTETALLHLLQLTNSALPVGAFSYSEGLETLVETGVIADAANVRHWLEQELAVGSIRLEAAAMVRGYRAIALGEHSALAYWNGWLSAVKDTEELRSQSWQMGQALRRLLQALAPEVQGQLDAVGESPNYALVFAIAARHWQIPLEAAALGYLHSWAMNLIGAAVKLIPLGQTTGQQLIADFYPNAIAASRDILALDDDNLYSCGWGLTLASIGHETLYTRLFRS